MTLDWLPQDLRRRGLDFLERSVENATRLPATMRPALVLDEPEADFPHVRFAHRVRSSLSIDGDLAAIAELAFGRAGSAQAV